MTLSALNTTAKEADWPTEPACNSLTWLVMVEVVAVVSPTKLRRCTSLAPTTAAVCCCTKPSLTKYTV